MAIRGLPNAYSSIDKYVFAGCSSLTSITIPNGVTTIEEGAFSNCNSLSSITIPNSVTSIGELAYTHCSNLTSVRIPNSVTTIGPSAFLGCNGLTSLIIGSSVKNIYTKAFASCLELTNVYCFSESVPVTSSDAFLDSFIDYSTLYVPTEAINAYKETEPWKNFKDIIPLEEESLETLEYTSSTDRIDVFSIDGKLISSAISPSDASDFIKQLPSSTTAIIRIGEKSVKILVK